VLDEPTSALDPSAAEDVLALLQRLVHDLGMTVLMAEHRLERVVQYADRIVLLPGGGAAAVIGLPGEVMTLAAVAPPVVELARLVGWTPVPLSVRDARRRAGELRERLRVVPEGNLATPIAPAVATPIAPAVATPIAPAVAARRLVDVRRLVVRYADTIALREVDLRVDAGEVVALMGRNGAGKSTLLTSLVGMTRPTGGTVTVGGAEPHLLKPRDLVRHVGLVPQEPGDLLYADTVRDECGHADQDAEATAGTSLELLAKFAPGIDPDRHPRDLSEGQRLSLALAVVLVGRPPLVLLDEPTRGLDYTGKAALVVRLRRLADDGHAVVLATHDVELAAALADRTVVLAGGEVVSDGPTREVVMSSPAFAPQVAKILAPLTLLTVDEVARALREAG
jgi:energy-coupling factor transporter ATP-binding protein EcfA2